MLLLIIQNADKQTNLESQEDLNGPHSIVINAKLNKNKHQTSTLTASVHFTIM